MGKPTNQERQKIPMPIIIFLQQYDDYGQRVSHLMSQYLELSLVDMQGPPLLTLKAF